MIISKQDFKSLLNFSFAAITLFVGHYYLLFYFPRYFYAPGALLIHPFMFVITIATIISVKIIFKRTKLNILGYTYLATSLVKMLFAVLFLIPHLINDSFSRKEYVLQFFAIYFIYLAVEVVYLVQEFKNS